MDEIHETFHIRSQVSEPSQSGVRAPSAQEVPNHAFVLAGENKRNHPKVVAREYGHLRRKSVEFAIADTKASKEEAFVWLEVLIAVAYCATPVIRHLLIEMEVPF